MGALSDTTVTKSCGGVGQLRHLLVPLGVRNTGFPTRLSHLLKSFGHLFRAFQERRLLCTNFAGAFCLSKLEAVSLVAIAGLRVGAIAR